MGKTGALALEGRGVRKKDPFEHIEFGRLGCVGPLVWIPTGQRRLQVRHFC